MPSVRRPWSAARTHETAIDIAVFSYIHQIESGQRLVAGLLMSAMGLPLGTMFPWGLHLAQQRQVPLAWCWALNGAASAAAAVYAIALSLSYGIEFTYWLSVLSYLAAFGLLWRVKS
jgi:hypothetical protein